MNSGIKDRKQTRDVLNRQVWDSVRSEPCPPSPRGSCFSQKQQNALQSPDSDEEFDVLHQPHDGANVCPLKDPVTVYTHFYPSGPSPPSCPGTAGGQILSILSARRPDSSVQFFDLVTSLVLISYS